MRDGARPGGTAPPLPMRRVALPSLTRRVALTVVGAFAGIFLLLFAVLWQQSMGRESGEIDRSLRRSAQDMVNQLDQRPGDAPAELLFALYGSSLAMRVPEDGPSVELAVLRRDGALGHRTLPLRGAELAGLPDGLHRRQLQGREWQLYVANGRAWTVVLADDTVARGQWLGRTLLGDLATYLAMALPMVLLPVWWLVRTALRPLRRLSEVVAGRAPSDTSPLQTERRWAELLPLQDALDRLFERTAQGLAREKAFVHDAAHELRTPLAVIATQAHLLAASEGAARTEAGQRLQAAVTRASHLTQQLLQLARADAAVQAAGTACDLMDLARDALSLMAERAAAQGTELDLQGPDQLPLQADAQALRSLLDNLLDNALRHGGPGGAVQVQVVADAPAGECRLTVQDAGPGIAEADRERVFERFWRAPGTAVPGTGLGLAIVRQAARGLGGSVQVQPRPPGCGACLQLRLPLRSSPPVPVSHRPGAPPPS